MLYPRLHRLFAMLFVMAMLLACVPIAAPSAPSAQVGNQDDSQAAISLTPATKNPDAQPVIWIGDFNNFDDAIALMLIAKDPRYRIDLIVVEESFNTVAHGAKPNLAVRRSPVTAQNCLPPFATLKAATSTAVATLLWTL